jgi:sulfane dehydrogenase subunit SoxC
MHSRQRRRFLRGSGTLAAGLLGVGTGAQGLTQPRAPGLPVSGYGQRARFETTQRWLTPARYLSSTASWSPLADQLGVITPSALHYERHHAGVPEIDPADHRLLVHGLVQRPLEFTLDDLRRFPLTERICFLECSGNSYREWRGAGGVDVQQTHGLTSCSVWSGVLLRDLLAECGVMAQAQWLVAEGGDAARLTRSLPLAKALDDTLLAYGQNGEALRPEQGYPLRLLVPGYEGSISVKWLRRLKLGDEAVYSREETSKYTDLMPDGRALAFTLAMDAKSVITSPSPGRTPLARGFQEIRGLAWSGRGRVTRVEVSVDGGQHWQDASLHGPVLPVCHTRFTLPWRFNAEPAVLASRCTDETGYVQPSRDTLVAARGKNSFYHYNAIQQWRVDADGSVHNA